MFGVAILWIGLPILAFVALRLAATYQPRDRDDSIASSNPNRTRASRLSNNDAPFYNPAYKIPSQRTTRSMKGLRTRAIGMPTEYVPMYQPFNMPTGALKTLDTLSLQGYGTPFVLSCDDGRTFLTVDPLLKENRPVFRVRMPDTASEQYKLRQIWRFVQIEKGKNRYFLRNESNALVVTAKIRTGGDFIPRMAPTKWDYEQGQVISVDRRSSRLQVLSYSNFTANPYLDQEPGNPYLVVRVEFSLHAWHVSPVVLTPRTRAMTTPVQTTFRPST